jgi:alanine-glyoxylate transaminase/serine-glyoxylate transaminase/serine-pyruvate transaminase
VHAETSSGVHQPIADIADVAHAADALVLADCVTSLGGVPVELDQWGVDMAYSVSQKCIGCPSGLAPVTFSERAMDVIRKRRTKPSTWYLDIQLLMEYWSGDVRAYHHTAPTNMFFALQEGLNILFEEGLDDVYARHRLHHRALVAGLEAMGLGLYVDPAIRLPQLNAVVIPEGADDATVRKTLLADYNIEIGGGLGGLKGRVWRVGIMGYSARRENVVLFLAALESVLGQQGVAINRGQALAAAAEAYSTPEA